ncbi:MAG: hypothetical protein DWQ31_07505 [Planctomycetota bacterium]|nr:MAG: hypothetical protein DWQ31_07505 [Planctomycetota bacterium]REJ89175.1 MAG: hypothetical protein DWQ35_18640 [Planctomycetota bacterium]
MSFRVIIATAMAVFLSAATAGQVALGQQDGPPASEPADEVELDSLDDELFEGLDEELDGEIDLEPSDRENLGDGEDVDLGGGDGGQDGADLGAEADRATKIGEIMRRVEELLAEKDLSPETREKQEQIVKELTDWLKELHRQRQQSQSQSQNQQQDQQQQARRNKPNPGQQQTPGNQQPTGGSQAATQPQPTEGEESDEELRDIAQKEVLLDLLRDSIDEFWGDLPERERERLRQMADVELLPEYAPLIRKYYQRLAEDENRRP